MGSWAVCLLTAEEWLRLDLSSETDPSLGCIGFSPSQRLMALKCGRF